jgi:hypothetical protein
MNSINAFDVNQKVNALPKSLLEQVDTFIDFLNFKKTKISKISDDTKRMLDNRLNDYLQNPTDVQNFDEMLEELERQL